MKLTDITEEQKRPLDYKIQTAVDAIQAGINASAHNISIAFSGGKDSTVLWNLMRTHFPEQAAHLYAIFGNTGVEYPESQTFARQLGREWAGDRFIEVLPALTSKPGYKYAAQREILDYLIATDTVRSVLKADGKLRTTEALERACPPHLREKFERERMIWKEGTRKSYFWCVDQFG